MKEQELQILEQYDVEVNSTRQVRGAVLCDTDRGLLLLRELNISKGRVTVLNRLCDCLYANGFDRIDRMIANREQEYVTVAENKTAYVLKRWFFGRECDIRREEDVTAAAANLARLHRILRKRDFTAQDEAAPIVTGEDVRQMYARYNREMKKVRAFIRKKVDKTEFELLYLKYYESMYEPADRAREALEASGYENLLKQSRKEGHYTHGEYNYHNLIMTPRGPATTNLEHFHNDVQMTDLYYYMRKVLEKNQWSVRLGSRMLEAYDRILPIQETELDFLAVLFSYPEKFRKAANSYSRSNKAFLPKKNLEKLELAVQQTQQRNTFLRQIFSFHL